MVWKAGFDAIAHIQTGAYNGWPLLNHTFHLQNPIVKNQVNAKIVTVNHDPFLTCHKGEAVQKSCSYC
jgi:hypothetical protein